MEISREIATTFVEFRPFNDSTLQITLCHAVNFSLAGLPEQAQQTLEQAYQLQCATPDYPLIIPSFARQVEQAVRAIAEIEEQADSPQARKTLSTLGVLSMPERETIINQQLAKKGRQPVRIISFIVCADIPATAHEHIESLPDVDRQQLQRSVEDHASDIQTALSRVMRPESGSQVSLEQAVSMILSDDAFKETREALRRFLPRTNRLLAIQVFLDQSYGVRVVAPTSGVYESTFIFIPPLEHAVKDQGIEEYITGFETAKAYARLAYELQKKDHSQDSVHRLIDEIAVRDPSADRKRIEFAGKLLAARIGVRNRKAYGWVQDREGVDRIALDVTDQRTAIELFGIFFRKSKGILPLDVKDILEEIDADYDLEDGLSMPQMLTSKKTEEKDLVPVDLWEVPVYPVPQWAQVPATDPDYFGNYLPHPEAIYELVHIEDIMQSSDLIFEYLRLRTQKDESSE